MTKSHNFADGSLAPLALALSIVLCYNTPMANDMIPSGNSAFERAAARVQAARKNEKPAAKTETVSGRVRARLNFIPDEDTLHELVDQALSAISRGVRWARGSILNIIV